MADAARKTADVAPLQCFWAPGQVTGALLLKFSREGPHFGFKVDGGYGVIYRGFLGQVVEKDTGTHFFGLRSPVGLWLLCASLFALVALRLLPCLVARKCYELQVASGFFLD